MLDRRHFSGWLAAAAIAAPVASVAQAHTTPVQGKDYARLPRPLPTPAGGKIEVVEFFWYGCPHCNALEPLLEAWLETLPADVAFRRAPVAFRREPFVAHQKLYYALETMGLVERLHGEVFAAIHRGGQRLSQLSEIRTFVARHGVDPVKFAEVFASFAVQSKARQAQQLSDAYAIDGVPAFGVHGRTFTSGSLAGPPQRMLQVTDYLIDQVRSSR